MSTHYLSLCYMPVIVSLSLLASFSVPSTAPPCHITKNITLSLPRYRLATAQRAPFCSSPSSLLKTVHSACRHPKNNTLLRATPIMCRPGTMRRTLCQGFLPLQPGTRGATLWLSAVNQLLSGSRFVWTSVVDVYIIFLICQFSQIFQQ